MKIPMWTAVVVLVLACGGDHDPTPGDQTMVAEQRHGSTITTDPADRSIIPGQRVGAINASVTEEDLVAVYGAESISPTRVHLGEEDFADGTALFAGSTDEVEILWRNDNNGCPANAFVSEQGSSWTLRGTVAIGSGVEVVQDANGSPFSFYGFDFDFEGWVVDWNGGRLRGAEVRFRLPDNFGDRVGEFTQAELGRIGGRVHLHSDDSLVQRVAPVVSEMGIVWPDTLPAVARCLDERVD